MRAEAVAFNRAPGHLQARGPLVPRADAVHPVIVRDEVAARPPQLRDVQIPDGLHHIFSETAGVRERRAFFKDAAVNTAPEVFDEIAVDFGVNLADDALSVYFDPGAQRALLRADGKGHGD